MIVPEILQKVLHMAPSYEKVDRKLYRKIDKSSFCPVDQSVIAEHNLGFNGRPANAITTLMHAREVGDLATEQMIERKLRVVTGERSVPSDADIRQVMNEFIPAYAQTPYEYQKFAEKLGVDKIRSQYRDAQNKARKAYAERMKSFFSDPVEPKKD